MDKTINIKFDKEQLEELVKKVTENIMKENKDNFYELSDTGREELKKKRSLMYLEANETHSESMKEKIYYGFLYNTLSKDFASMFYLDDEFDRKKVEELKSKGWKEEVFYK